MNENKSRILAAASALFLEGGSQALSVRAIAGRAGLSTIGIYSHFEGKQGILDALYIEGFTRVKEAMEVQGGSARQAVLRAASNYLQLAETSEAHYKLIFGDSDGSYTPSVQAAEVAAVAFGSLTRVVGGLFGDAPTQNEKLDAALQVWALLHGSVALNQHAVASLVDMSQWRDTVMVAIEILIDGIVARR